MTTFLLAALAVSVRAASVESHTLRVSVSNGKTSFVRTAAVSFGESVNPMGPVTGSDGSRRNMILNVVLGGSAGNMALSYQVELAGLKGSEAPSLQVQGEVAIRPGTAVRVLECGAWTMDVGLDSAGKTDPKSQAGAWSDQGLGNWLLTLDLAGAGGKVQCRQVVKPGSQGNIVDSAKRGGKKAALILNHVLASAGGTASLEYQLDYTPAVGGHLVLQERRSLAPGRHSASEAQGYKLDFLAEGPSAPAAGPAAAPAPAPAAAPDESKAIPLLR